jgi:endo-alpha-1,4-polygalactosaminidase (GH114 family)
LVYAYIDIGYANSNYYYWESDWDIEYPAWIDDDYEYTKYQTKYWRSAWKAYIINIINEAHDLDFDGFVFGGLDANRNY